MTDLPLVGDRSRDALVDGFRRSEFAALGVTATGPVTNGRQRLVHLSCS